LYQRATGMEKEKGQRGKKKRSGISSETYLRKEAPPSASKVLHHDLEERGN